MSKEEVNYFGAHPHIGPLSRKPDDEHDQRDRQVQRQSRRERPSRPQRAARAAGNPEPALFADGVPASYSLEDVPRDAWVEVDLDAIARNVRLARRHLGGVRHIMAVVKADAYGHGAVPVAKIALENGADHLGVATVEEGVELRKAGIEAPVLVLSQPPMSTIPALLAYDIMPTVFTTDFALALGEVADRRGLVAKYHLAVDTGMNRIGVFYLDVVDFVQSINFHRGIELAGVFTHFATADEENDWDFRIQLERFQDALQLMRNAAIDPGIVHCANSAAIERFPDAYFDMGRLGITMYGLSPSPYLNGHDRLVPAMQVKARITLVKEPQLGEGVSYGFTYRVAKPVQIATLPIGYADGIRRELSGQMKVLWNGRPCRQVGSICMDQMMIEIPLNYTLENNGQGASIGDEVVIIGPQGGLEVTADMMAEQIGTINYEVVCGLGMRLPRVYVHGDQ